MLATNNHRKPIRVLHAYKIYRPDVEGGIPAVISALTRGEDTEIVSSVLVARPKGPGSNYLVDDIKVTAVGSLGTLFSMPIAPGYLPTLWGRFAANDVIVHHAPFPLTDIAVAAIPRRTALVVHWHAEIVDRQFLRMMLSPAIRHSLSRADAIIVSHSSIIKHSPYLAPYADKCVVVPYGADVSYWSETDSASVPAVKALQSRHPKLVLAIGRLVPYKGFSVLLEAMQGLDAHLTIVGDGPLLKMLQQEAVRLNVSESVTLAGRLPIKEVRQLVHAARVLVMPSISAAEAFGIVQIEAMAAGLPIVNTNLPTAVPYIARHGLEGLTVEPRNSGDLRASIRRLLEDAAFAKTLGKAARIRARTEYSLDLFRERNFAVYRSAIARRAQL